jgi:hypothetical protein
MLSSKAKVSFLWYLNYRPINYHHKLISGVPVQFKKGINFLGLS